MFFFFSSKVCDVWITTKSQIKPKKKKIFLLNFFSPATKTNLMLWNEECKWLCVRLRYFFVHVGYFNFVNRTKNKRIFPTMIVVNEIVIYWNRQNAAGHGKAETTITNFSLYCMLCSASRELFTNGKIYCYLNSTRIISFCNEIRLVFVQHHQHNKKKLLGEN